MKKICVYGAGAIGGHLAARLARGGSAVSVVARGAQLAAIRDRGLTVRAPDGEHHSRPEASDDPAALGVQDAVIVAVKQPALPSVARAIGPLLGPETVVAFVMNGIPWWYFDRHGGPWDGTRLPGLDPDDQVRQAVGVERTLGGVVYSDCTVVEPGVVFVGLPNARLILGELDGSVSDRARALAAAVAAGGGFTAEATANIRKAVWAKMMANIVIGPLCILSRQGIRPTYADPAVFAAGQAMMTEAMAISAALGQPMDFTVEQRMANPTDHKPSIRQDLEMGRPMEIEAQMDAPLRLARMLDLPTPTLDLMIALAKQAAAATGIHPAR